MPQLLFNKITPFLLLAIVILFIAGCKKKR